jgi:hypothetical protein
MSQKEQREAEKGHFQTPTIGRLKGLSDRELSVLFEASVLNAMTEIRSLNDIFGISDVNWRIKTYTQLDDAASLIEATMEELSDIASDMRHLSREMEGRDRIDG